MKEELSLRQRSNERYSLRAFLRDLNMHPATLAMVMQAKRPLPKKNRNFVIQQLELTPSEEFIFKESLILKKCLLDKIEVSSDYQNRYIVDDSNYKVLAE